MIILGIETSCDETGAAVLKQDKKGIHILSNVIASSADLQSKYGGIIPEQAAREQIKSIIPVIETAINDSRLMIKDIDAIAVTYGPGLIGSLLVGVETSKVLAKVWNKPLIPINHLLGHFYANWISREQESRIMNYDSIPSFPCIGLLVSGGHTDLVLFTNHGKYKYLGGTRDDAVGECFDKCARLLGLPYPGGPEISKLALQGDALRFELPRPMIHSKDLDFSFSGLKTSVANIVKSSELVVSSKKQRANLAASIEQAIVDILVEKTTKATQKYEISQIMVAGGVAANQKLVDRLQVTMNSVNSKIILHIPNTNLCTDNGAMIAAAGFFESERINPLNLQANPNLSLDH